MINAFDENTLWRTVLVLVKLPALEARFCCDSLSQPSLVLITAVFTIVDVCVVGLLGADEPPPLPLFAIANELIAVSAINTNAFMTYPFSRECFLGKFWPA